MLATDVVDVDVLEVDTVCRIQNCQGRRSHISRCVDRSEWGMTRSLFMCEGKVVGVSTWATNSIPIGWPDERGQVQEIVEGTEVVVFRAGGTWVFCNNDGICGDSEPSAEPRVILTKAGVRDIHIESLNRNRCYAFVAQAPGMVSCNGIAFSVPRCYCIAVWDWRGKEKMHSLPMRDWDVAGFATPRMFPAKEGMSLCSHLTPDACVGVVAPVEGKLVRYMNVDLTRAMRIRDGSMSEFASCLQRAGVHSLAGDGLTLTCGKLAASGVDSRYVSMYREAVKDIWEFYMQEKVWKRRSRPLVKIVRCFVTALHGEYLKRIGSVNPQTDLHRVQLFFASKCPMGLADVIMRWRERSPKAKTP